MPSRSGGRRKLTDAQAVKILEWYHNRKTRAQLARELGVGTHVIAQAITRRGQYKSPSPEHRDRNRRERRAVIEDLRARGWLS